VMWSRSGKFDRTWMRWCWCGHVRANLTEREWCVWCGHVRASLTEREWSVWCGHVRANLTEREWCAADVVTFCLTWPNVNDVVGMWSRSGKFDRTWMICVMWSCSVRFYWMWMMLGDTYLCFSKCVQVLCSGLSPAVVPRSRVVWVLWSLTFGQMWPNVNDVVMIWSLFGNFTERERCGGDVWWWCGNFRLDLTEHEWCGVDVVTFGQIWPNVNDGVMMWSLLVKFDRTWLMWCWCGYFRSNLSEREWWCGDVVFLSMWAAKTTLKYVLIVELIVVRTALSFMNNKRNFQRKFSKICVEGMKKNE
jgi:hypothetical protein